MSDEGIKPALTAEEWEKFKFSGLAPKSTRQEVAMAMYGEPFAFTWEDVDLLRIAQDAFLDVGDSAAHVGEAFARLAGELADRIAALLPPREP